MKKWILVVLALQTLVLLMMAGKREWIHAQGDVVYLRTAPVDPRDIFRGDYVELAYDISSPSAALIKGAMDDPATTETNWSSDMKQRSVYVGLKLDPDGVAQISRLFEHEPEQGLFIKGRIGRGDRHSWRQNGLIRYGIEKYFVEQGSGLELEERRGRGEDWQTAMEVEVALGSDGTAVIRGFRWSSFDTKLEVLESNQTSGSPPAGPKVALSLRNQSEKAISIPDSDSHCGFQLEGISWGADTRGAIRQITAVNRDCENEELIWYSLPPGDTYTATVDFSDQKWLLENPDTPENSPASITELSNFSGFRLVYDPAANPGYVDTNEETTLLTRLRSARFNAWGRVD